MINGGMLTVLEVVFMDCTVGRGVVVDIFIPNGTTLAVCATVDMTVDDDAVDDGVSVDDDDDTFWACSCAELSRNRTNTRLWTPITGGWQSAIEDNLQRMSSLLFSADFD